MYVLQYVPELCVSSKAAHSCSGPTSGAAFDDRGDGPTGGSF